MTGSSEKASHYIAALDAARVNASWSELLELIRKVKKHAPQRKTLIDTATAEHEVATGSSAGAGRPTTSSAVQSGPLATLSNTLQADGQQDVEASFQGRTCLLWSRWLSSGKGFATAGFDVAAGVKELEGKSINTWTTICIVKSAYIEGTNYVQNGRPAEAQRVFNIALSNIKSSQALVLSTPQLAYWAEQLLAQLAQRSRRQTETGALDAAQIEAFKYWAIIAAKTQEVPASTYRNSNVHLSRFSIWRKYYEYLSAVINSQDGTQQSKGTASLLEQSTEIRQVERNYENELLRTIKFPTATQTNEIVEQWIEQAVRNWQVLCGPQWRDADLEGGRDKYTRNMLDILYRAADKTFQSASILRRLFQVHLSLGEFGLAYRAFDTYMELVERGRVRVAKSGQPEPGHESDEAVLSTMSEAVTALCKFGHHAEARKAYDLSLKLEDRLESLGIENGIDSDYEPSNGQVNIAAGHSTINPYVLQAVCRAIGTAKAHWARWTAESESRSDLQQDALTSLRQACSFGRPDTETLYATSLVLAETRDIDAAIQTTKQALANRLPAVTSSTDWATERKLVSLWHLLALLLSSRQDFDSATKGCVAAFEQFAPGEIELRPGRNLSISSSIEKQFNSVVSGITQDMEPDELQRIIEVRITDLALIELMDGPGEAVNRSNELLSLYSRLFSHFQTPLESSASTRTLVSPKSSAGTTKSARTSALGHKKGDMPTSLMKEKNEDTASMITSTTRPSTRATQAPTIQVTNEDEKKTSKKHHIRRSLESAHSKITADSGSKRQSLRHGHRAQDEPRNQVMVPDQSSAPPQSASLPQSMNTRHLPTPLIPGEHENLVEAKQTLPEVDNSLNSHKNVSPPVPHDEQPPEQDTHLSTVNQFRNATSPPPRLPKSVAQRQALTVLAKVWLVIATLYRRANMFEDSKEACEEAGKAASKIEAIVGAVDHSARAFAEAGWGAGAKSADEVWADVYCERAELQLAVYRHKVKENENASNEELRAAVDQYEQCLMFVPNHPSGIIGLSNVLLDSFERKVDLGRRVNGSRLHIAEQEYPQPPTIIISTDPSSQEPTTMHSDHPTSPFKPVDDVLRKSPENLNRIAARDRAYGLLSTLTKLGSGWDDSRAWFALARAHELGGEIEKAKSVLWWCVELEDSKPIRHWRNLGYVL